jgi:saccharopine dehydrogenase-like NADP-dependent oxidoreductase
MAKICQIGAGMVGRTMALDLSTNHDLYLADFNLDHLESIKLTSPSIHIKQLDVNIKSDLVDFIEPADIVLLAVPGFMGYRTLKVILESRKDVVDISFSPENLMKLSDIAVKNNVTAIFDTGVAPGLPNYALGFHNKEIDIQSFEYYVGGLPLFPEPPFNYKAPFSPIDVIEEYTRPARMMKDNKIITKPAMSDLEIKGFKGVGELEAFNTDGLRSILYTMNHISNMKEKTLRYPGHIKLVQEYLKDGRFEPKNIKKTSKELFQAWKLKKDEPEFTLLDIIIKSPDKVIKYHLYDEFDSINKNSSMARTTGYTATASIHLILNNLFNKKGVFPPEIVGEKQECFEFIVSYLKDRKVNFKKV